MLFWRLFSADWLIVGTRHLMPPIPHTSPTAHTQQHRRQAVRVFSRCNTIPLGWKKHGDELYIDKVLDPAFPFRSRSCSSYSYSSASSLPSHVYPYIIQPGACVFNAFAEWAESTCLISIPPPLRALPPHTSLLIFPWHSITPPKLDNRNNISSFHFWFHFDCGFCIFILFWFRSYFLKLNEINSQSGGGIKLKNHWNPLLGGIIISENFWLFLFAGHRLMTTLKNKNNKEKTYQFRLYIRSYIRNIAT
jgi:hypothetical protein